jgi:glycosyltransferase involved in cell wall biosynthesis
LPWRISFGLRSDGHFLNGSATSERNCPLDAVWIVVPAFNEAAVIGSVVARLRAVYPQVIVVDDGSADATRDVAIAGGAHVLAHPFNLGQGAALQTGITYALRQGASTIVTFDADGQHQVADIDALLARLAATGSDIVCGSRFLGSTANLPRVRRWLLKAGILFTRWTTGLPMTDSHNGLRAMTRRCAETICIRENRMAHASEIIEEVARHRLKLSEVPVHIEYTAYSMQKGQRMSGMFEILFDLLMRKVTR